MTQRTVEGFEQAIAQAKHVAKYMGQEGKQVIKVLDVILDQAHELKNDGNTKFIDKETEEAY